MYDAVVEQPLEKCLLLLSYVADKALVDDLQHKEAMRQVNHQTHNDLYESCCYYN